MDKLDLLGYVDGQLIEKAEEFTVSKKKHKWIIRIAIAACLCLMLIGSFDIFRRFDYFQGVGCSAAPGTVLDGVYYFNVDHSGVWRYSDGSAEKILSTYWEDGGWLVNETGLYYSRGKTVFRMDLDTLERNKIFSTNEGTHIGFELAEEGNITVTVYDRNARYKYQLLVSGTDGGVIRPLTDKISYDSYAPTYTELNYQVGTRKIALSRIGGDENEPYYMPTENGVPLLQGDRRVGDYGYRHVDGVLYFDVYRKDATKEESECLILFADGTTFLVPERCAFCGAIGHILLYVDYDSPENFGTNGNGIWCFDPETSDRWQLRPDTDCEFYAFVNDGQMLYSCVPWNNDQTAWKIVYTDGRPAMLQMTERDISE